MLDITLAAKGRFLKLSASSVTVDNIAKNAGVRERTFVWLA